MVQLYNNVLDALMSSDGDSVDARFKWWLGKLGNEVFVPFMSGGVSAALISPDAVEVNARLERVFAEMDVSSFVALMKATVVRRILDDAFLSNLIECHKRHVSPKSRETMVTFFHEWCSEIDRLGASEFWRRVDELCALGAAQATARTIMRS